MKELVFLENNQALTTSLKAKKQIETALNFAKESHLLRVGLETETGEANLNSMAWWIKDISETFYQFENIKEAIPVVLDAFNEITHYMTPKEAEAFLTLISMARDGIITGYLRPLMANESKKTTPACVYVLKMENHSVKIGITADFQSRLSTVMRNGGMNVLNWCHTKYINRNEAHKIESACHVFFQRQRLNGEFFNISFEEACTELEKHTAITTRH